MKAVYPGLLLVILMIICKTGYGQDLIYKNNGQVINARISAADSTSVTFYKEADPDKTLTRLSSQIIDSIHYFDGRSISYSRSPQLIPVKKTLRKNMVMVNMFDLLMYGSINISYEKIIGMENLGILAGIGIDPSPGTISYYSGPDFTDMSDYGNAFSQGAPFYLRTGINYYPVNRNRIKFGAGGFIVAGAYKSMNSYLLDPPVDYKFFMRLMIGLNLRFYISNSLFLYSNFDITLLPGFLFEPIYFAAGAGLAF